MNFKEMNSQLTVAKFGGTSMGTVESMQKCADIIQNDRSIRLVTVSATSGTTSALLELATLAQQGERVKTVTKFDDLEKRHLCMAGDLGLAEEEISKIQSLLREAKTLVEGIFLLQEVSAKTKDRLMSVGERMSSLLFTKSLKNSGLSAITFDVRKVMKTDNKFGRATVQLEKLRNLSIEHLVPLMTDYDVVVTQGFLGSTDEGETTTLGRGGSDYSASLLAEAIDAEVLHIWTDVDGIKSTDPRITPKVQKIKRISFSEAAELATFGAKILHPATLVPAMRKDIPVFVGNTFDCEAEGTWILKDVEQKPLIRAVSLRRGQRLLTVTSLKMVNAHGFLERIFGILARHKVSVDLVTTSEVSVSLTIDAHYEISDEVIEELGTFCDVRMEDGLSLVAIVGNQMHSTPGLASRAFEEISPFNIRMICQGASPHNICFIVDEESAEEVVRVLHRKFLEEVPNMRFLEEEAQVEALQ